MITYVELWKAKQEWLDLPQAERGNYMAALGTGIQQLVESGVQIISWGKNEDSTANRAPYDYFAVWSFPNSEAAQNFEQIVEGAGWYRYFEQVNASGNAGTPQQVIEELIGM